MDIKTCTLLSEYNRKTNETMNSLIREMDESQWLMKFDGYYPTVKSLCNHLYIGDLSWLRRFATLRPFAFAGSPLITKPIDIRAEAFQAVSEYLQMRAALDDLIDAFIRELTEADLDATLSYVNFRGEAQVRDYGGLVLHFFNHQTHHRGMISVYLDSMKIVNDFSNLSLLV